MNWIEQFVANTAIKRMEAKMLGTGWKGKAGGIAAMLGGLAGLLKEFSDGTLDVQKVMNYWAMIAAGFSLFGIRQAVGRAAAGSEVAATTVDTKPPAVG